MSGKYHGLPRKSIIFLTPTYPVVGRFRAQNHPGIKGSFRGHREGGREGGRDEQGRCTGAGREEGG